MKHTSRMRLTALFALVLVTGAVMLSVFPAQAVFAQDVPAGETPIVEPTAVPPTAVPPTAVPPMRWHPVAPTAVPTAVQPPVPAPAPKPTNIPEPITVVLFGTGLAALSAAVAARRKKND